MSLIYLIHVVQYIYEYNLFEYCIQGRNQNLHLQGWGKREPGEAKPIVKVFRSI